MGRQLPLRERGSATLVLPGGCAELAPQGKQQHISQPRVGRGGPGQVAQAGPAFRARLKKGSVQPQKFCVAARCGFKSTHPRARWPRGEAHVGRETQPTSFQSLFFSTSQPMPLCTC